MKKLFRLPVAAAMIIALGFSSCSSDDSNPVDPTNEIINDNNEIVKDVDKDVTLMAGETYFINRGIHVTEDASLTIEEDVTIKNGESSYLLVEQGSKIFIKGSAGKEVVFTVNTQEAKPGAWGGLIVNGQAPINVDGGTATAEVGDAIYGGQINDDNSGSIEYAVFKYGGNQINSEKEHNGVTLNGVGSGTKLDHIAVYNASDDAFEWFGGTVNATNLFAYGSQDDIFDWTYGWTGSVENIYGEHNSAINNGENDRGIEADNNGSNFQALPLSKPMITNLTLVDKDNVGSNGLKLRAGTAFDLTNVVIEGFGKVADGAATKSIIDVETLESIGHIEDATSSIEKLKYMATNGTELTYSVKAGSGQEDATDAQIEAVKGFFGAGLDASATGAPQALVTWGKSVAVGDSDAK